VHSEERAISLSLMKCCTNRGSLAISFRCGTQSDPSISSVAYAIMIPSSNSSIKRSGMPNHYIGDLLHTIAISGLSRVSVWADGPRNLMKITSSRMQNRTGSER
jgi:hypothetical protein